MVTQWTRQKAQWLSQRGLSWPWTALTRLLVQLPIFSGMSSISTKLLNSSWQTRGPSMKVFRPLLLRGTAPSTCKNGQCKHQIRLCTTVLWETQWRRAAGRAERKPRCRWSSGCGQPRKGVLFSLQCAMLEILSKLFQVCSSEPIGPRNSWVALQRGICGRRVQKGT